MYHNFYNQNGFYQPPNGSSDMPPINPNQFFAAQMGQKKAVEAKRLGLIALVCLCLSALLSVILGVMAIRAANASRTMVGHLMPEAKSGRTFGYIGVIGGVLSFVLSYALLISYL